MTVEEQYDHFAVLSSMLPRIVHQDYSEQQVSKKYQHNPSGNKKRKLKKIVDDTAADTIPDNGDNGASNVLQDNDTNSKKRTKKARVMSVEKVQSLDLSELKERLQQKITLAKTTRNHSDYKLKRRKESRLQKAKDKHFKKKTIEKAVKLETSILDDKKKISKQSKDPVSSTNIQFSKFETKTKEDLDLQSAKERGKKKNLVKMLNEAKKKKKEVTVLQKSSDEKSATVLQDKAWLKAISMAKGEKQKDNPELIVKTIKRKEQSKKKSKKEWTTREGGQKKLQKDKQKKRQANIEKRIQGTKQKKQKK